MTTLVNTFEGGTQGTTITTGNSGGASGNAFDSVAIGTAATLAFDSTQAAHGTLSAVVSTAGTATTSLLQWQGSMGTLTQMWFRVYLYFTGNPAVAFSILRAFNGASQCAGFDINTNGTLRGRDSANSSVFTSTAAIPLNQWFRVETMILCSATTGQIELKLFTSADSTTPAEVDTSAASLNTGTQATNYRYGILNSTANVAAFWMDDLGLSGTGYLGPFGYLYQGQQACDYLDYLDMATGQTLTPAPGGYYQMTPVNSRAGLTVPPPQRPWFPSGSAGGGALFAPLISHPAGSAAWDRDAHRRLGPAGPQVSLAEARAATDPRTPAPLTPDAMHGHYAGSVCRHCDPAPAEPPPLIRRVDGPDFAPAPSLAEVRAALARSPIVHGHYTPCRCEHCAVPGDQK